MATNATQPVQCLLLSPCLSPYDDVESGILYVYLEKAIQNVYQKPPVIFNLLRDTPWVLYRESCLRGASFGPVGEDPTLKYVVLHLAVLATILYLTSQSQFVMINGNGPVINDGFATMIGFLAAIDKPVVYWKDDVRRLYGARDNPIISGLLPPVSDKISRIADPSFSSQPFPDRLNYIDTSQDNSCGNTYLDEVLRNLNVSSAYNAPVPPKIAFIVKMGQSIFTQVYNGQFKQLADQYSSIKDVIGTFVKQDSQFTRFFGAEQNFLSSKL